MEPGRELDAKVAEAMGWKLINSDNLTWETPQGIRTWEFTSFGSFRPSTDWAAAGQAFEWLEINNPWGPGSVFLGRDLHTVQPCVIYQPYNAAPEIARTIGKTFPHAIALAVLAVAKEKTR